MSIRVARILIVGAACLMGLSACSTAPKLNDETSSAAPKTAASPASSAILAVESKTAAIDGGDTTGSVQRSPAEPGPSGEPVAPLAHPGLLGDDPNDDLQLGKKYFRSNNFGLAEQQLPQGGRNASARCRAPGSGSPRPTTGCAASISPTAPTRRPCASSARRRKSSTTRASPTCCAATTPAPARSSKRPSAKDPSNPYIQDNLELLEESYRNGRAIQ